MSHFGRGRSRRSGAVLFMIVAIALAGSACGSSVANSAPQPSETSTASGSNGGTAAGALDAATLAKVKRVIQQFKNTNQTPGVLAGIWSPRGTFVSAIGVANLTTGARLRTDMQFKIASQTKTFTANLILQLVGEGKVSLERPHLQVGEGCAQRDKITIRELLNHTSGLADGFTSPTVQAKVQTGCTVHYLLTTEAKMPPVASPGTKWSYSNYGYNLLGRVVELATGQDLSTAIDQRIAKPLGLHRTLLPTTGNGLTVPFTHGYGTGQVGPTQAPHASDDATALPASCLWAHGGMVSTLSDMRVWSRALATGSLLKKVVWSEARRRHDPLRLPWRLQRSRPLALRTWVRRVRWVRGRRRQLRRLRIGRHVLPCPTHDDRSGIHQAGQRDHASADDSGPWHGGLWPQHRLRAHTRPSARAQLAATPESVALSR